MNEVAAVDAAELWVVTFTLVLARVSAFIITFPLFGQRFIPQLVKVGVCLSLTVAWLPTYALAMQSIPVPSDSWVGYAVSMMGEFVVGGFLGYAFGLLLLPMRMAGLYVGQEMGLNLSGITDPGSQTASNETGLIFDVLGTLLLLNLNVHHVMLLTLHASFSVLQLNRAFVYDAVRSYGRTLSATHDVSFLLIAPLATCLFVILIVLAIVMRAWPQINLFSMGIGIRLSVGFLALIVFLPNILSKLEQFFYSAMEAMPHYLLGL